MTRTPPAYAVFGRVRWERPEPFHHVAERLAERHPVVYVEFPRRIGDADGGRTSEPAPGVVSVRPVDLPLQRFAVLRRATERAAARDVRHALGGDVRPLVAILYARSPLAPVRELDPDLVVYHAIDDFGVRFDGTPDDAFAEWEREALAMTDLVSAVSQPLGARLAHARTVTLPNGYDERVFVREGALDAQVAALPGPRAGFVGTVRIERLDLPLIDALTRERPGMSFVFVGEVVGADPDWDAIAARPNVHVLGARPFTGVPAVLRALDVAISPYRDTRFDRACSPLKIVEALAMGVPAVGAPARPDLSDLAPHATFASDASALVAALDRVADRVVPEGRVPSWDTLTRTLERHVDDALGRT